MSSNTLLPHHWRHLLNHFLKPVESETETTIKTKSKYSLMYNKWQVRSWYRGINKAVDLVTMLRFVLALENWVWAKIKRVYRWFTETLLWPLLEIAKWVLGICAYETTTMICLSDQQTKDSSRAIPNAQSNLNWISYIWKRIFFSDVVSFTIFFWVHLSLSYGLVYLTMTHD